MTTSFKNDSPFTEISGIWKSKSGKSIGFTTKKGAITIPAGVRVVITPNTKKKPGSQEPDYRMAYVALDPPAEAPQEGFDPGF